MAAVTLPAIPAETVALAVACFLAGAMVPVYYAQERFRGFGRAMMAKLPYQPPPGQQAEQAMIEATSETDADADNQQQEATDETA